MAWPWGKPLPEPERGPSDLAKKDLELRGTQYSTYVEKSYETAGATVDRYRSAATLVQTVATALGALYTGALALVFGEAQGGLPARGLLTPAFFALALVLSLVYSAHLAPQWRRQDRPPLWTMPAQVAAEQQLAAYRLHIGRLVTRNIGALHAAIVALGAALATAPAPFVRPAERAVDPTPWPEPQGTAADALLLYEAELAEVAARRAEELSSLGPFFDPLWDLSWLAAGAVLVAVVVGWARHVTARELAKFPD